MFDDYNKLIIPDWPAPKNVKALVSTRRSFQQHQTQMNETSGFDHFNLALHVNDNVEQVQKNRQTLSQHLGSNAKKIIWLDQVHGTKVVNTLTAVSESTRQIVSADASTSKEAGHVCTIMTADCLPVLFCNIPHFEERQQVAASHAGWRGLADGILSKTLAEFPQPENVICWFGPAISQSKFEVGQEVYDAFVSKNHSNKKAFTASKSSSSVCPKWQASLTELAKIELKQAGIKAIYGGEYCTYEQEDLFYSYRRDGAQSGRMVSLIMVTEE